jgi:hypothetical protein
MLALIYLAIAILVSKELTQSKECGIQKHTPLLTTFAFLDKLPSRIELIEEQTKARFISIVSAFFEPAQTETTENSENRTLTVHAANKIVFDSITISPLDPLSPASLQAASIPPVKKNTCLLCCESRRPFYFETHTIASLEQFYKYQQLLAERKLLAEELELRVIALEPELALIYRIVLFTIKTAGSTPPVSSAYYHGRAT